MTKESLSIVSDFMEQLSISYSLQVWKGELPSIYFVGDYTEVPLNTTEENGESEDTFYLDGYSRGSLLELEEVKEKIRNALPKRVITDSNSVVALFYDGGKPIRTGDAEIKRIQITLKIKEWKGE